MGEKFQGDSSFKTGDDFDSVGRTISWAFHGLIYVILLLLSFFSTDVPLKYSALAGLIAVSFYLLFFKTLYLEKKLRRLKKGTGKWNSLLEGLEEERFYFSDGKAKPGVSSLLIDFLGLFFQAGTFLLFLKETGGYRFFDSSGRNKGSRKRTLATDNPLVLFVQGQSVTDVVSLGPEKERLVHSTPWLKQRAFDSVFAFRAKQELAGFILFSREKSDISSEEEKLLSLVGCRLSRIEKIRELEKEFHPGKEESAGKSDQERASVPSDQSEEKRRIFDLYSLFQAANQIYSSPDHNRLFFNFAQNLQKQLNCKSVLILLPEPGARELRAKYYKGIDFHQFSELGLEEQDPVHERLTGKESVFQLCRLLEEYPGNEFLSGLINLGLQVCYPVSLPPDDKLGLVLLGGRTRGIGCDQETLLILDFLSSVLKVSLGNITQYRKLEELSYTDSLSGLYNHRYFVKRLNEEIFRAKRYQRKLAFVIFDIDEFKNYNDSYGHQSGDKIIQQLGELILKVVRSIDIVCRYGGDEFCVIMPETDQEECLKFIERLRKSIQHQPFRDEFLQMEHQLTVSAGAAIYPQHARTVEKLVYCADMALLNAKNSGKNKVLVFSGEEMPLKDALHL